jgi:choline dehydrogenase-like flavoprotein
VDGQHADVLIVGAGAAGGVAGRRLAEAGFRVVCLEQGTWPDRTDFPGDKPERELLAARRWSSVPSLRRSPADHPIDVSSSDVGILNYNGVGGGTVLYAAQWPRMLPDDFRLRSVDGVADDWPITYDELSPFYERTERQFGVSGLGGNPAYPPGADPPLPPLPIGDAGLCLARAHARLGWHWWPAPNAIASVPYDGRRPCVQRGTCTSGCNEGAKASTDLTHWPHVVANGGAVITGARVRRLLTDQRGLVYAAEWLGDDGRERVTTADVVLCAANAVGTARLLLASSSAAQPDGLANSSGLVGRRLMLHPLSTVAGVFAERFADWQSHAGGLIQSLQFATHDPARGFAGGATWELGSAGGPVRAAHRADGRLVTGTEHHGHVRSRLGHVARWAILCEDLPDDANRVVLAGRDDGTGVEIARLEYRLSGDSRENVAFQIARASESLLEGGAIDVEVHSMLPNGHLMGTARMGDDPARSVVDRWGIAHDVPNLGIVDGSVFVTAGSANPTSTIAALALRTADHLIEQRGDVPIPSVPRLFAGFASSVHSPAAAVARPVAVRPTTDLTAEQSSRLFVLAALVIPGDERMPDGGTVIAAGTLIERVLAVRPDLAPPLRDLLDASTRDSAADLEHLDDLGRRVLEQCVVGAYYLDADVLDLIGWDDAPRAVQVRGYPEYVTEGLLDHLLTAGPGQR